MSVLADQLRTVLKLDPAADAMDFDGRWYSWGQLTETVESVGHCLGQLGLGADARVGVMVRNQPSSFAAVLSVIARDGCVASINPMLPAERLVTDLKHLSAPVVIAQSNELTPTILQAIRESGAALIEMPGILQGAAFRPGYEEISGNPVIRNSGTIIEMLTSGTTGVPKRIALSRDAVTGSYFAALSYEKGRSPDDPPALRDDVVMLTNPLSHIGGLWGALTCVLDGRKACLVEKFSVASFVAAIRRHRPKVAGAVPAALRMILDADVPREDLSSLRALRTGTAPLDPAIIDEFMDRYGIPVLQNYGATEFAGAVAGWTMKDFHTYHHVKVGSVGRFQPGVTGRVLNPETGVEVLRGEEGVLEMRAQQFGNGLDWLRTTDRAVIDADGFLFIRGRYDNAIIRGGFKVHPDDVVKALEQHPAVREAIVVGIDDRRLGAVPVAALILKSGAAGPSHEEMTAFAKERLVAYQVPVRFEIVEDVPRTPSLKPALPQVRALFQDAQDSAA